MKVQKTKQAIEPIDLIDDYKKGIRSIQDTLYILSGKWKVPIMAILCSGEFRYSEIEQGVPKITPKMLSKELKILELNQLVERKVYDSTPVKVTYRLTKHGKTLEPLIIEMLEWGAKHRDKIRTIK